MGSMALHCDRSAWNVNIKNKVDSKRLTQLRQPGCTKMFSRFNLIGTELFKIVLKLRFRVNPMIDSSKARACNF